MTDLPDLTVVAMRRLVVARDVSCAELVAAVLERLASTEPRLHAYASVAAEAARREAGDVDTRIARGEPVGSLAGIPFNVKDVVNVAGLPMEQGSRAFAGRIAAKDATVVRRLRAADAVLVGTSVTHELQLGVSPVPTGNAWDPARIPGGSSAGAAASVAIGSAAFAVGTDTGGSIRAPAAFNGVAGLKPTYGRVSRRGVAGVGGSLGHIGPLARTAEDLAAVLQAIAGPDPLDRGASDRAVPDFHVPAEVDLAGVVVGVDREHALHHGVSPDVRGAVEAALALLQDLGASVVDVRIPELDSMEEVGAAMALSESTAEHLPRLLAEPDAFHPRTATMVRLGTVIPGPAYVTAQRARGRLRDAMAAAFARSGLDVLAGPTVPVVAPPRSDAAPSLISSSQDELAGALRLAFPASVTGQPALSVPCGFSEGGLPIGLQLMGRPYGEAELLRIGHAYERAARWHVRRPPHSPKGRGQP